MKVNNIELSIVVNGSVCSEYEATINGNTKRYIEGRYGSEYSIRVKNNSYRRIEAVISVDGRSVVNGKLAGDNDASGYILNPWQTIEIPGFKVDGDSVAKFAFSGKDKSYTAAVSGGDTSNTGVIGVRVFSEKVKAVALRQPFNAASYGKTCRGKPREDGTRSGSSGDDDSPRMSTLRGSMDITASLSAHVEQELGTAFGNKTDFATRQVSFDREGQIAVLALYYDSLSGLHARGIDTSPKAKKFSSEPNPFPTSSGCPIPEGWTG